MSVASVLSQKKLYTFCHSGLDPESSVFDLDSRFRGNDDFGNNVERSVGCISLDLEKVYFHQRRGGWSHAL